MPVDRHQAYNQSENLAEETMRESTKHKILFKACGRLTEMDRSQNISKIHVTLTRKITLIRTDHKLFFPEHCHYKLRTMILR
jgi:hypothetical protein